MVTALFSRLVMIFAAAALMAGGVAPGYAHPCSKTTAIASQGAGPDCPGDMPCDSSNPVCGKCLLCPPAPIASPGLTALPELVGARLQPAWPPSAARTGLFIEPDLFPPIA